MKLVFLALVHRGVLKPLKLRVVVAHLLLLLLEVNWNLLIKHKNHVCTAVVRVEFWIIFLWIKTTLQKTLRQILHVA